MTAAPPTASPSDRRKLMVGKGWVQAVALVVIFGFFVMGILAYRTYTASMPQPEKVVTANGEVLFTGADITAGQELFLARGLMEYGSIVGHGAYLGPDYTADYLRRATDFVEAQLRRVRYRRTARGGDRRVPHQPVRRGHRDPDLHRQPGQGLRGQHAALRPVLRRGLHQERAGPDG